MKRQLIHGDSVKELKNFDDNSVDLLCTDPPYGYGFMGRDWDKVLPDIKIFEECFRVLKPGSMAFVMSAPRSDVQYRMAEMLEKVGFRIDYTPIYWTYATGFPKAMNISKMIDKQKKGERNGKSDEFATYIKSRREKLNLTKGYVDKEICDGSSMYSFYEGRNNENGDWAIYLPNKERYEKLKKLLQMDDRFDDFIDNTVKVVDTKDGDFGYQKDGDRWDNEYKITKPNSDKAKELDGAYGGFQPKPAVEVVLVAMKPLDKKGYLEQAQDNGKGITWFDDCRIPFDEGDTPETQNYRKKDGNETRGWNNSSGYGRDSEPKTTKRKPREDGTVFKTSGFKSENNDTAEASPMGRFPANLLVSDDIIDDGKIRTAKPHGGDGKPLDTQGMGWGFKRMASSISDSGGYSRYFSLDEWFSKNIKSLPEPVQQTFPFMIVPKASKAEKNNGLDNFETKQVTGGGGGVGDYIDDVNSASGKFGSEKAPSRNIHPTVKPLTLMNYLVVLGSRKGDIVLEPFAGSGTTALACVSQERDYIAIEREEEYYDIAKARLEKVEQPLKMWEKFS